MKHLLNLVLFLSTLFTSNHILAQVGIGTTTPDVNAQLDISSPDKGLLIPRMTEAARVNMGNATNGMLVYQTDVSKGFYFRQKDAWVKLNTGGSSIIPYASGEAASITTSPFNVVDPPVYVGFGSSAQGAAAEGASIDLTFALQNYAFSVPRAGVIESISAYFTNSNIPLVPFFGTLTLTAQLYASGTPNNVFTPLPGAVVILPVVQAFPAPPLSVGQVFNGIATGLNIPVTPGTRLLMVYSVSATGATGPTTLTGHISGGISIAGE